MDDGSTHVEIRVVLLQVRGDELAVGAVHSPTDRSVSSLPGGPLGPDEDAAACARRHLREDVGIHAPAHIEQLAVFSEPARVPDRRTLAVTFLALLPTEGTAPPSPAEPAVMWLPARTPGTLIADHGDILAAGVARLAAKLTYTTIGFALAPPEFTMSELRDVYAAGLGHRVDATNLQRVLMRRDVIEPSGGHASPGRTGGRPGALFRYTRRDLRVTDRFAALKPPL